ncbi:glucose/arabinose dehydrogenase [Skermanella aerolata]|uniref:hypothetical protein n=1 Tax=Skermanella aerolata TaxID=393310 RepID=UPI003D20CBC6
MNLTPRMAMAGMMAAALLLSTSVLPAKAQTADPAEPAPVEAAAPPPEPPKADIASAVTCQVLIGQFDDSVAAAKVEDAVKASARTLRGEGNKACNAWDYQAGIGSIRVAIETIGRKPIR